MSETLYELAEAVCKIKEMANNPDADPQEMADTLESVEWDFEVKADNIAKVMAELDAQISVINKEVERLQARAKTISNNKDWLKNYLYRQMVAAGKKKFQTDLFTFGIQKNGGKAPLIIKEGTTTDDVPPEFIKWGDPKLDNEKIRKAIENGEELEFAKIGERGESLRIR